MRTARAAAQEFGPSPRASPSLRVSGSSVRGGPGLDLARGVGRAELAVDRRGLDAERVGAAPLGAAGLARAPQRLREHVARVGAQLRVDVLLRADAVRLAQIVDAARRLAEVDVRGAEPVQRVRERGVIGAELLAQQ